MYNNKKLLICDILLEFLLYSFAYIRDTIEKQNILFFENFHHTPQYRCCFVQHFVSTELQENSFIIPNPKPHHKQMKYFCDYCIVLLAEEVSAAFVNLLQLCLGSELFKPEHVLKVTDSIMMSILCCTFADLFSRQREVTYYFPHADYPV